MIFMHLTIWRTVQTHRVILNCHAMDLVKDTGLFSKTLYSLGVSLFNADDVK